MIKNNLKFRMIILKNLMSIFKFLAQLLFNYIVLDNNPNSIVGQKHNLQLQKHNTFIKRIFLCNNVNFNYFLANLKICQKYQVMKLHKTSFKMLFQQQMKQNLIIKKHLLLIVFMNNSELIYSIQLANMILSLLFMTKMKNLVIIIQLNLIILTQKGK